MAGGGIKINNNSIRGGADGITYTPRIGADGLLYFDPNRRGYNSIGGFVIKGANGKDGADGLPGRDGAKGEKGATGAKLVAMVPDPANTGDGNKYTMYFDDGTVAEFVAPRGEKGDQGEQGIQGEKGADGKSVELAETLENNDTDKAPSVKSVKKEFDAVKEDLETTIISVGTIAERVQEIDLKVGQSYKTVMQMFNAETCIKVNEKHVGTHVAFSTLAPSYGYNATKAAPISNPYVEPFTSASDGYGYDPSVYEVSTSINSGKLRISINSLTEDLDGYGIAVFFDSLATIKRQVVGVGVTVVSGSFTNGDGILATGLYSKRIDTTFAGFDFENVTRAGESGKAFFKLNSNFKEIDGLVINTGAGEMFTNYVIDVDLYLEPEIVCEVPQKVYSAGKYYLENTFSRAAILAEEAGASLTLVAFDPNYRVRYNSFNLDNMEIEVKVVKTEDGPVCLDEPRYIPVAAPLFNLVFPATAGEEISLYHTSAMDGVELINKSEILYVAKS